MKNLLFLLLFIPFLGNTQNIISTPTVATYWLDTTSVATGAILPAEISTENFNKELLAYTVRDTTNQWKPNGTTWICVGQYNRNTEINFLGRYLDIATSNTRNKFTGPKPVTAQ